MKTGSSSNKALCANALFAHRPFRKVQRSTSLHKWWVSIRRFRKTEKLELQCGCLLYTIHANGRSRETEIIHTTDSRPIHPQACDNPSPYFRPVSLFKLKELYPGPLLLFWGIFCADDGVRTLPSAAHIGDDDEWNPANAFGDAGPVGKNPNLGEVGDS